MSSLPGHSTAILVEWLAQLGTPRDAATCIFPCPNRVHSHAFAAKCRFARYLLLPRIVEHHFVDEELDRLVPMRLDEEE